MSDDVTLVIDFESDSRFDAFSRLLAQGLSQRRAFNEAGFRKNEYPAPALAKHPEIKKRVASYLDQRLDKHENEDIPSGMDLPSMYNLTAEWVIENLMQNAKTAMANGSHAAANKSLEMLGQHIGLFGGAQGKDPAKVGAQVQASLPDLMKFAESFAEGQKKAAAKYLPDEDEDDEGDSE